MTTQNNVFYYPSIVVGLVRLIRRSLKIFVKAQASANPQLAAAENAAANAINAQIDIATLYEHHRHSVARQHSQSEALIADPPLGTLYLSYDFKEYMTLPLGPMEGAFT